MTIFLFLLFLVVLGIAADAKFRGPWVADYPYEDDL